MLAYHADHKGCGQHGGLSEAYPLSFDPQLNTRPSSHSASWQPNRTASRLTHLSSSLMEVVSRPERGLRMESVTTARVSMGGSRPQSNMTLNREASTLILWPYQP